MTFEVTILGSNSALPAHGRHPTCQYVHINNHHFLIDAGEATQINLSKYHIKRSKVNHIFISHLHGDHYYGLMGLITSYHLMRRESPLHLFAHPQLEGIINAHLEASNTTLKYQLIFHRTDVDPGTVLYENDELSVSTIPMEHRIPTNGFLFKEKTRPRNILPEQIEKHGVSTDQIPELRKGKDVTNEKGETITNALLTKDPAPPRTYAYFSDTKYKEDLIRYAQGVDLLYHEATFENEAAERASETFHSTSGQAGKFAALAGVKQLIVGHFSAKYGDLSTILEEARAEFPNTDLAEEGKTFSIEH